MSLMVIKRFAVVCLVGLGCFFGVAQAAAGSGVTFNVDPVLGDDANPGHPPKTAFKSIAPKGWPGEVKAVVRC